jgi:hypothetical protein
MLYHRLFSHFFIFFGENNPFPATINSIILLFFYEKGVQYGIY